MQKIYETSDFYFVAFIHSKGYEILGANKVGSKISFEFENSDEFKEIRNNYFLGKASVEPIAFQNAIHNLKTLTYNI